MVEFNNCTELLDTVRNACYVGGHKIYFDSSSLNGTPVARYKLSGARISDETLKPLQDKLIGGKLHSGKEYEIILVGRNKYTTGGRFTSPEDVCIYLKEI